jgi:hypothetical protein
MKKMSTHTKWLSMIEVAGPFLATPVLEKVFPQGLEVFNIHLRRRLRLAYEEWRDAVEEKDAQLNELHLAWNELVLRELLEFDESVLSPVSGKEELTFRTLDGDGIFTPDFALHAGNSEKPRLLIAIFPPGTDLEKVEVGDQWPVSIQDRMMLLCRAQGVGFGLISNGERWMLIHAPIGSSSANVSWYARFWFQEEDTLRAFQSLLGVRRWFGPDDQSLSAMLDESLKNLDEITDTLGEQVRRAVEVLVQSLDKADLDRNRELLQNVSPAELYEAGLTVMMRLVFILCAEERGLLLLGDPLYDQYYAISTLRAQLAEESGRHGNEILERRHDGWARLLAIFRIIYGGVEHDMLRMPALGGSLFDPDRFSFLEGRAKGTVWKDTPAQPLPIDNRTVLLLLEALQILEQTGGASMLSYKALDVEQIGHVYEGLLEYTVQRVTKDTLGLVGSQKMKYPNITLAELESAEKESLEALVLIVKNVTERSERAIENAFKKVVDGEAFGKVLVACGGDTRLANRVSRYAHLMRTDAWNDFIVYRKGSFAVTLGADRRETGTHYTPKSLTEGIVETTLETIVYVGSAEGKPREDRQLKSSAELLELKICDPAMGSGAFLVQACRWLSERLMEAWRKEEMDGKSITADGYPLDRMGNEEPMPSSLDERLLIARRLIAERCLYGVDKNPMAVELAKLSIWLITLSKGRPFGFLDHNFRAGDSLLGLYKIEQLTRFSLYPEKKQDKTLFASNIDDVVNEVMVLRKKLRNVPIRDIRDIQNMERLDAESKQKIKHLEHIADAMISEALYARGNEKTLEGRLNNLSDWALKYIEDNEASDGRAMRQVMKGLSNDISGGRLPHRPFHWCLEFPEVFQNGGFDAIIGNPPFLWGNRISSFLGDSYRDWLLYSHGDMNGNADLCAHFYRRAFDLLGNGCFGLIATNSISETDNRTSSLVPILKEGGVIFSALSNLQWPGKAGLHISIVHVAKGDYKGYATLDGKRVDSISSFLDSNSSNPEPHILERNSDKSFKGVDTGGLGFVMEEHEIEKNSKSSPKSSKLIWPLLNGDDFLDSPYHEPSRRIINFSEMTLEEAEKHPFLLNIVKKRVFPYRQTVKSKGAKDNWWLYNRPRPALYNAISKLDTVLVNCVVSKFICFSFVPTRIVFTNALNVFAIDDHSTFAVLQSTVHDLWARYYGSSLENRNRYNPTDCFETFPFPENMSVCNEIGKKYFKLREKELQSQKKGLTAIYNQFHDPKVVSETINSLRELHAQMDRKVIEAFGWTDLELNHGFYDVKEGARFTISEAAAQEILKRLLKLNHEYHEEEGMISYVMNKKKDTQVKKKKSRTTFKDNLGLFDS